MDHHLIVFDRSAGQIIRCATFSDRAEALRERFAAEREHRGSPHIEVVVLGAASWEDLRRTHGRYFERTGDLAATALRRFGLD